MENEAKCRSESGIPGEDEGGKAEISVYRELNSRPKLYN